jgi:hypothetical protein
MSSFAAPGALKEPKPPRSAALSAVEIVPLSSGHLLQPCMSVKGPLNKSYLAQQSEKQASVPKRRKEETHGKRPKYIIERLSPISMDIMIQAWKRPL